MNFKIGISLPSTPLTHTSNLTEKNTCMYDALQQNM